MSVCLSICYISSLKVLKLKVEGKVVPVLN